MKKLFAALLVVILVAAAGAGWYVWLRPHDRLALARSLMTKGDARAAQLELRSTLLADPSNAEAHFRLGEVQLRLGDPLAAEKELTDAQRLGWDPKAIVAPLSQAVLAQGRYAEVMASFSPDGLPPDKAASVLVARSNAALALHKTPEAQAAANQAERLAPQALGPALASAEVAMASQDTKAADQAIGRALAIDPHSTATLMLQAQQRQRAGDAPGALASLDAAVASAPADGQPRFERAQLLMGMGRDGAAGDDVAALLKQDPRSPGANYLHAQLLLHAHDFAAADAALEAVGPTLTNLPRGEMLRAIVKANVNQPEQAAEAAGHYLGRAPEDPAAYNLVAALALQAHRPADAAEALHRALLAGRANAETYSQLGQAEAQLGHGDAAVAAMQSAAALAPKDQAILARLATLQLGRGDASAAAGDLQHLLDLQPGAVAPKPTDISATAPGASATAAAANAAPNPATAAPARLPSPAETATALILASLQAGETDRAAAALERLRRLNVPGSQVDMLAGLLKTAQLDLPGAQRAFQGALASPGITPAQTAAARTDLAGVLDLMGQHDQAEAMLRQVLATDPANLAALSALERLLLATGQQDAAVKALETAHQAAPANASLTVALANLYDRTAQPARALALLDAQRQAAPAGATAAGTPPTAAAQQADLQLQAARMQAQLAAGKRQDAEATLRQMLGERPADVGIRSRLVSLLLGDHDAAGAQALVDEGLAAQPGAPPLLSLSVATALQSGGVAAALDRADMLARDPANMPAAALLKGQTYMAVKDYKAAATAFTAQLQGGDAPSSVALASAGAEQAAGQPDRAAGLLRDYLTAHPSAADVGSALAVLEIGAKQLEPARADLEHVLQQQPNNPAALNNLAWVDEQLHRPDQARAMAQRSWLLSATPQAADTLGWILLGGDAGPPAPDQAGTALALLRQAAASLPGDASVQYHYAMALKDNGQLPQAATVLTGLLKRPAFDEQPQARKLLQSLPHS